MVQRWCRGGAEEVVQRLLCRGGIEEGVQRCWSRGCAGAEVQMHIGAEVLSKCRGSGFNRGGAEVVGASAELMQRCCWCRGAAEVVLLWCRGQTEVWCIGGAGGSGA